MNKVIYHPEIPSYLWNSIKPVLPAEFYSDMDHVVHLVQQYFDTHPGVIEALSDFHVIEGTVKVSYVRADQNLDIHFQGTVEVKGDSTLDEKIIDGRMYLAAIPGPVTQSPTDQHTLIHITTATLED